MMKIQSVLVAAVIAAFSSGANCDITRFEFDAVVTFVSLQKDLPKTIKIGDVFSGHVDMDPDLAPPVQRLPFLEYGSYNISPATQDWIEAEVSIGGVKYSTVGLVGTGGFVFIQDTSRGDDYAISTIFKNPGSYYNESFLLAANLTSNQMPSLSTDFIQGVGLEQNFTWNLESDNHDPPTGTFSHSDEILPYPAKWSTVMLSFSLLRVEVGPVVIPRFNDVPEDHWAFSHIERLASSGITSGCGDNKYCPENRVTRAQMAVFLERGMRGSDFNPGPGVGNIFLDVVAGYWAGGWIELLYSDGITSGCGSNKYCPANSTTRAQMAVFLLRAKYGMDYAPPTPNGVFNDVSLTHWSAGWIEQLAAEGITSGCGGGNYCPNRSVTRAQMAVFLVKTFGL